MSGEHPEKPVRLQTAAKLEALDAFNWYEERNPNVADRFDEQLREAFSSIARRPQLYPRYPGQPLVQFVELKSFPYLVIYRNLEDEVEVIAVVHARRQPLYWDLRLKSEGDRHSSSPKPVSGTGTRIASRHLSPRVSAHFVSDLRRLKS